MRIVLLGPPGAGKGTLAEMIRDKYGVQHISTGDLLREEMQAGSDIGQRIKKFVESGDLVPDGVVIELIREKLTRSDISKKGYMLDGFPRTTVQAEKLDEILEEIQLPVTSVLYMQASLTVVVQRLTGRRVCRKCGALYHTVNKAPQKEGVCDRCGGELYQRPDDNEETIKNRMDVYLKNTQPIIQYYAKQDKLVNIDADQESGIVFQKLEELLHEKNC